MGAPVLVAVVQLPNVRITGRVRRGGGWLLGRKQPGSAAKKSGKRKPLDRGPGVSGAEGCPR